MGVYGHMANAIPASKTNIQIAVNESPAQPPT